MRCAEAHAAADMSLWEAWYSQDGVTVFFGTSAENQDVVMVSFIVHSAAQPRHRGAPAFSCSSDRAFADCIVHGDGGAHTGCQATHAAPGRAAGASHGATIAQACCHGLHTAAAGHMQACRPEQGPTCCQFHGQARQHAVQKRKEPLGSI